MFERDLPGENKSGLSFQKASAQLPLETCETMNDSWGFNIKYDNYKSVNAIIRYLVNAAGRNANFLLNVGPMPNGKIQTQFTDTLKVVGDWMRQFGESVYGTRGNVMSPQQWGVVTAKDKKIFVHVLQQPETATLEIPVNEKVKNCRILNSDKPVKFEQKKRTVSFSTAGIDWADVDTIIEIALK